jgi:hypothetical protein
MGQTLHTSGIDARQIAVEMIFRHGLEAPGIALDRLELAERAGTAVRSRCGRPWRRRSTSGRSRCRASALTQTFTTADGASSAGIEPIIERHERTGASGATLRDGLC